MEKHMLSTKSKRAIFHFTLISTLSLCNSAAHAATSPNNPINALEMLLDGNQRFVKGNTIHPSYLAEAKDKMLEQQTPFAAIVGCSDSRVPPELIFDRGLGELFVVRDAGNVLGPIEIDSIEFAVARLKVPIVIVMGHQNCGAVKATLNGQDNVPELENIYPLIESSLKNCEAIGTDTLVGAIHCNIKKGVDVLKNSPTIAPLLKQKKVKVVGAYFDIATGKVTLLPD
jgi:carbonic anhydrase